MGRTMLLGVLRMPKELLTDDDPVDKIQRHSRYLEAANVIEEQDKDIETYLERVQLQEEELIRLKSVEASFNQMINSMKDMVRHGHYSSQALNILIESLPLKTLGDNVTNDGLNQDQPANYYIRQGADSKPREGVGPKGLDKGLPKNEFGPSVDSPTIAQRYEVFSEEECERNSAHEPAKEEGQSTDSGENAPNSIRASWNGEVTHADLASSTNDSGTTCSENCGGGMALDFESLNRPVLETVAKGLCADNEFIQKRSINSNAIEKVNQKAKARKDNETW